ncbi:MAG: 50S ribosomal protein L24 [Clostridia bacterium]|nr:50S ribosomal protein L24 [Clostridia bacterium]
MNTNKKLPVRTGDTVVVITGVDKGKKGKIMETIPKKGRVVVEGVAMVTRHQKPRGQGMPGGLVNKEAAINASNVLLVCDKCGKATRHAHQILEDGKKARLCKKCGATFDA